MNRMRLIRARLGVTQEELSAGIGCTRGNIPHLERGQTITPGMARRLIAFASVLGVRLTYDQIYGDEELPPPRILPRRVVEQV